MSVLSPGIQEVISKFKLVSNLFNTVLINDLSSNLLVRRDHRAPHWHVVDVRLVSHWSRCTPPAHVPCPLPEHFQPAQGASDQSRSCLADWHQSLYPIPGSRMWHPIASQGNSVHRFLSLPPDSEHLQPWHCLTHLQIQSLTHKHGSRNF